MDSAYIYNPEYGDEDNVQDQLVFYWGQHDRNVQIRQLGVAQGLVELAHSFDGNPVSWIETKTHLILIQRLEADPRSEGPDSWRNGFWFSCSVPLPVNVTPESLQVTINDGYARWRLHNGAIGGSMAAAESKDRFQRWWGAWCSNWTGANELGATGCFPYIRLEPGTLCPSAAEDAIKLAREVGAKDLLVTTADANFIWQGKCLDLETKVALQHWLRECSLCEDPSYNETSGYVYHLRRTSQLAAWNRTLDPEPTPVVAESAVVAEEPAIDAETETLNSHELPQQEWDPNLRSRSPETAQSSRIMPYFSLGNIVPSLPSMRDLPGVNTLSGMSMPSMPSMPAMPSFLSPSLSFGWSGSSSPTVAAPAKPEPARFIAANQSIYSANGKLFLLCYRRNRILYTLLFDKPTEASKTMQRSLDHFAANVEGFSFALAPTTRFAYLLVDTEKGAIVSTLPDDPESHQLHESIIVAEKDVARRPGLEEQIFRTKDNWWVLWKRLDATSHAYFCKRWRRLDASSLLGALHKETSEWSEQYKQRSPSASHPAAPIATAPPESTAPPEPTVPTESPEPTKPTKPAEPTEPTEPTEPAEPAEPMDPTESAEPTESSEPMEPTEPTETPTSL